MPANLVSILIPVYNCRDWLGRTIDSALAKSWPNCEVIALDDRLDRRQLGILQQYRGRIRIERAQRNPGQNAARNLLTSMSRGDVASLPRCRRRTDADKRLRRR